ncbi:hypothetical protein G6F35_018951 [Rhizopus arrhizus]|nr:hypothetical protein G6F35_018951 [Rhizopus arrhizus]
MASEKIDPRNSTTPRVARSRGGAVCCSTMAMGGAPTDVIVPMMPEATPAPDTRPGVAVKRRPATLSATAARIRQANSTPSACGAKRAMA